MRCGRRLKASACGSDDAVVSQSGKNSALNRALCNSISMFKSHLAQPVSNTMLNSIQQKIHNATEGGNNVKSTRYDMM
jgi:hypothetical protein